MKLMIWMRSAIRAMVVLSLLLVVVMNAGCSHLRFPAAFKIDVAQGNILEIEKVNQLQPGMTKRQVVYLLGNPVMRDSFQPHIWNYVYQFSRGGAAPQRYRLELRFEGDILRTIKGDKNQIKPWHKNEIFGVNKRIFVKAGA